MFLKESTEAGCVVNKNGGCSKVNVIENVTKNVPSDVCQIWYLVDPWGQIILL